MFFYLAQAEFFLAFKVAVFQPDSFYGKVLCKHFDDHGYTLLPGELCFDDASAATAELMEAGPALVVVAEAFAHSQHNAVLAEACLSCEVPVIFLSSHQVFSAVQQGPLMEATQPVPQGPAAENLLSAEQAYLATNAVVLRLPWVIDGEDEMLHQLCNALVHSETLVLCDQWRACLVDVDDVMRVVFAIAQQITCGASNWGVYHLRSSDDFSELELVERIKGILDKAGCETLANIRLGGSEQRLFRGNAWLGGNRCTNDFGIQLRSWRQGLKSRTVKWISKQVDLGLVVLHPNKEH